MGRLKPILFALVFTALGTVIGGYLFSQSQPRSFLALNRCSHCHSLTELMGLMGSVGMLRFPGLIPAVVFETDKTVVIRYPFLEDRSHYVLIPKTDIKDIADISEENVKYLVDMVAVAAAIIRKENLSN